jgi:Tol biopolymer transport system component
MTRTQAVPRWIRRFVVLAVGAWSLAGCSGSSSATAHPAPASDPGGSSVGALAFVASPPGSPNTNVFVAAARGGSPQALTTGGPPVWDASWTANGSKLVFARRSLHSNATGFAAGRFDVFVLRRGGKPQLIRRCPFTCQAHSFAWSPDGRQIAFVTNIRSHATGTAGEIAVMNADGSGFHVVCNEAACGQGLDDPRWSPDGSQLLFSNMAVIDFPSLSTPPSRIWVARPDGSDAHPLTQPGCRPGHPPLRGCAYDSAASWSSDGDWIAFSRYLERLPTHRARTSRTVIELMHPDGSDLHSIATSRGILCNAVMSPVWSPNGSRIAYAPKSERGSAIVIVTPAGDASTIRTCAGARCVTPFDLVWAPDGRSLGLLGLLGRGRSSTTYVIHAAGGGMHAVGQRTQCCLAWLTSP